MKKLTTLKALQLFIPLIALPISASATTFTWTNGNNTGIWNDPLNWSGGSGSDVPALNSDVAVFNTGPMSINMQSFDTQASLDFQTAGWTITGSSAASIGLYNTTPEALKSSGAGTNTIEVAIINERGNSWNVATGNTLLHTGRIAVDVGADIIGGGTVIMNSSSAQNSTSNFTVSGGLLLINYDQPEATAKQSRPTVDGTGIMGGSGTIQTGPGDGTVPLQLRVGNGGTGGTLNPGGNGTAEGGPVIGTLGASFSSAYVGDNGNVVNFYDSGVFQVDVDPVSNTSDLLNVTLDGSATSSGYILIDAGATLDILTVGSVGFDPGDEFTIATFPNIANISDYGTFDTVLLDGLNAFLDPNFYINYNVNDITIGLIPEPSVYALLGGMAVLGFVCLRRRQA